MYKHKRLVLLFFLMILLSSSLVLSDGGFFRPRPYFDKDLREPSQKAMILFDGQEETLILQVNYEGDMTDFAWVVPVPAYPEINKTSPYLFEELHFLTEPKYRRGPSMFFGGMTMGTKMLGEGFQNGVNVLEQKQVGIYNVTVLSSENPEAMINWLNAHDYYISPDAEQVLDFYIQKNWYFVAMRIDLAPYDASLVGSLKKINSSITSPEDAQIILTNDLVNYIKSEKTYSQIPSLKTELNYGSDDTEERRNYPSRPEVLISEQKYTQLYEQYNGYLENHMLSEIESRVREEIDSKVKVPERWMCRHPEQYPKINASLCYIWDITKDSSEYRLLDGVECGDYCLQGNSFEIENVSALAAYAIINGNEEVKSYFGVTEQEDRWYENKEDRFNNVRQQVDLFLNQKAKQAASTAEQELTQSLISDYKAKTNNDFDTIEEYITMFSSFTLLYLKEDKPYESFHAAKCDVLTYYDYSSLKQLYQGTHDELVLRAGIEPAVQNVLSWKTSVVKQQLKTGYLQPLSLTFATSSIVYPLKISSVNTGASEILLYVFAKYRTEVSNLEGFNTEYAKWIETSDIKTQRYYDYVDRLGSQKPMEIMPPYYYNSGVYYNLNQLLNDRYFLTKMRGEFWPREMTDDLLIVQSDNDKSYRLVVYDDHFVRTWIFFIIFIAILTALIAGITIPLKILTNKIIRNETSSLRMTNRRCFIYAAILPVIILLAYASEGFADFLGEFIDHTISQIMEFFLNLFHYLTGVDGIGVFVGLIFLVVLSFVIVHLAASGIVELYRKVRK
ncbi:MAG: DUF2330 domain-containing protein [Candidatus Nanoarchaeia archaeon]